MHLPGVVTFLHLHATGNEVAVSRRDDSISWISMSVCSRGSRQLTMATPPRRRSRQRRSLGRGDRRSCKIGLGVKRSLDRWQPRFSL